MTTQELIGLIKEMRAYQKEYFVSRDKEALAKAKELERQVDDVIWRAEVYYSKKERKEKKS